jgi:site-specific recombinase XerD
LASFLAKRGILPGEIAIQHLTRYIARDDSANATTQRRLVILKQFFRWAGHPVSRELDSLRAPKVVRPVPDFLSEAEERQLRQTLKTRTDKKHHARDRALICLMLDTGVRVSEAVGLNISDVDLDSKRIHLVTKGGKKRSKFISADVRGQFSTLFAQLPSKSSLDLPVFQSGKGGRLTDRQVRQILSSWAELSGITKPVHPHMLRHTFATSLLGKTGNLRLVQKALDHENPQTTAIYAHVVDEELQAAIDNRL